MFLATSLVWHLRMGKWTRVTSFGEILPFGPLLGYFLGENMFCCRYFKSSGEVGCRCFELWWRYFDLFCFGNCFGYYFGYFFQNLGKFFPKLLVTLQGALPHTEALCFTPNFRFGRKLLQLKNRKKAVRSKVSAPC